MTGEPTHYELGGFAIPEGLEDLHDLLNRVSAEHSAIDPMAFMLFETAVTEIANNVIEHGRPEGKVRWQFAIDVTERRLEATLSDSGEVFTGSLDADMPDVLAEGGRGLALARSMLDELTYERIEGVNVWHLARAAQ
ncbi:MAG TPA: ATP-binding protein [Nocardioides sp.]|nr:ATP-binding protein [Nocardioides sp.]